MNPRQTPRPRIILAAMVPFALLALVGMGLAAVQAYKACFWGRAEAAFVRSESVILARGARADHSYSKVHYRFARKGGGGDVQLYFLERASSSPREKSIAVLYDPSVRGEINDWEGSRWDRASNVYVLLFVGLGMTVAGVLPCLVGVALLVRERRKLPPPLPPLAIPV